MALVVLLIAGLTDILDGYLARSQGKVSQLGEMLDPLADKSMMLAVIVSLLIAGLIPWQAALAVFVRETGMITGSALFHIIGKKHVPANFRGKLTTVLYYLAILLIFWEISIAIPYLWVVIILSFITSILYLIEISKLNRNHRKA